MDEDEMNEATEMLENNSTENRFVNLKIQISIMELTYIWTNENAFSNTCMHKKHLLSSLIFHFQSTIRIYKKYFLTTVYNESSETGEGI